MFMKFHKQSQIITEFYCDACIYIINGHIKSVKKCFFRVHRQNILAVAETISCVFIYFTSKFVIERAICFVIITHQLAATKGFSFKHDNANMQSELFSESCGHLCKWFILSGTVAERENEQHAKRSWEVHIGM